MSELTQVLGRIERDGDDVAVVFDRHYATTAPDLWAACTDPDRLARRVRPVTGGPQHPRVRLGLARDHQALTRRDQDARRGHGVQAGPDFAA